MNYLRFLSSQKRGFFNLVLNGFLSSILMESGMQFQIKVAW